MAITLSTTNVERSDYKEANKKVKVRAIAFSGNYTTGGETLSPSDPSLGMKRIEQVYFHGTFTSTGVGLSAAPVAGSTNWSIQAFETGASSGAVFAEKGSAEAWPALTIAYATIVGF